MHIIVNMSLIQEMLHLQLRQFLSVIRRCDSDIHLMNPKNNPNCDKRRAPGGQDELSQHSTVTLSPQHRVPAEHRCIMPMLNVCLRLHEAHPSRAGEARLRQHRRHQFRQRSVLENLRHVLRIHWPRLSRLFFTEPPGVTNTNLPPSVGVQTEAAGNDEAEVLPSHVIKYIIKLRKRFKLISRKLEVALRPGGSSPKYVTTSPGMDIVNIGELVEQVNSVLIDHLLENTVSSNESLTEFDIFAQANILDR